MNARLSQIFFLLAAALMLVTSCATEPGLDKAKFAELNRAAQDLKAAIGSGKGCEATDAVVQRLSSGTAALQNRTASKTERDLLSAYGHLLSIARDGALLCQSRSLLSGFPFLPKGRIYVPQELDSLVEKYDLPTEKHLYGPTGKYWRSIPDTSIMVVWEYAETEIQHIENVVKYSD